MTPRNFDWKIKTGDGNISLCVPVWLKNRLNAEACRRNLTVNEVCRRVLITGLCRSMESDFTVSVQCLESEASAFLP